MTEEEKAEFISKRRESKARENTGAKEAGSTLATVYSDAHPRTPQPSPSNTHARARASIVITVVIVHCLPPLPARCFMLPQLARQLQKDGPSDQLKDERESDKLPLDVRMQGATAMLAKTREANYAGWQGMNVQAKRDLMYQQLANENAESSVSMRNSSILIFLLT